MKRTTDSYTIAVLKSVSDMLIGRGLLAHDKEMETLHNSVLRAIEQETRKQTRGRAWIGPT